MSTSPAIPLDEMVGPCDCSTMTPRTARSEIRPGAYRHAFFIGSTTTETMHANLVPVLLFR